MGGDFTQYPNSQAKGAKRTSAVGNMTLIGPSKLEVHQGPDGDVHVHDRDAGTKMTCNPDKFLERYSELKKEILDSGADVAKLPGHGGVLVATKAVDYDDSGKIIWALEPKQTGFEPMDKFAEDLGKIGG